MDGGRCRPQAVGEGPRAAVAAVAVAAAAGRGHNRKSRREPPGPAPRRAPPRSGRARPPPGALCTAPGPVRRSGASGAAESEAGTPGAAARPQLALCARSLRLGGQPWRRDRRFPRDAGGTLAVGPLTSGTNLVVPLTRFPRESSGWFVPWPGGAERLGKTRGCQVQSPCRCGYLDPN